MKIRISHLAPSALVKRIKSCLKKAGLEWDYTNCYGEIWSGAPQQVDLAVKKLNDIFKAILYVEVIR
jgi:hypothetical protein